MAIRLEQIAALVQSDPAAVLPQVSVIRQLYTQELAETDLELLKGYEEKALVALQDSFAVAREKKDWLHARSLHRSLAAASRMPASISYAALCLEQAASLLADGDELGAFLAAAEAHEHAPLSAQDALRFAQAAMEARQRRSAAWFSQAAQSAGARLPAALSEYLAQIDRPADMIKGVATVWVDRGIKLEGGRGSLDRVIGSAFFISRDGLLITNYHVISSEVDPEYEGFSRLYIRLGNAASLRIPAKVVGWDPVLDLAVIKAEVDPEYIFSVLDVALSAVGDQVYAIGSPVSLEKTVTSGIVSSKSRRFLPLGDVLQIDAAINQGNSGGPVVDTHGRLVGVAFAGIEEYEGLNFALSGQRLSRVLPALLSGGEIKHAWIGLALNDNLRGLEIIYTAPGSPARLLSLKEGLYIERLANLQVREERETGLVRMQDELLRRSVGELVVLTLSDGEARLVQLQERPAVPLAKAAAMERKERLTAPLFGFSLVQGGSFAMGRTTSISRVYQGTIGEEAGLSENDPVVLRNLTVFPKDGYALLDITIKKRKMGFLETFVTLPALLDSPDLL